MDTTNAIILDTDHEINKPGIINNQTMNKIKSLNESGPRSTMRIDTETDLEKNE